MKNVFEFFKKEMMLTVSLIVALISLFITPPSLKLLYDIDFKTLAILFMLLSVLDGFKNEKLFNPLIKVVRNFKSQYILTLFLVFGVFFSSMFVTNDVSLIIFVPLTILLFRSGNKEKYLVTTLVLENIAAVRGSLLTPFGSPQNLFLYEKSEIDVISFLKMMFPLTVMSMIFLILFITFIYRKDLSESNNIKEALSDLELDPNRKNKRTIYLLLFVLVIFTIVSRISFWYVVLAIVTITLFIFDREVFKRVDYVLLLTFFCFFIFSSSIAANPNIAGFLMENVAEHEYLWSLGLSQIISNVPASIVLWPFSSNLRALLYGLDTAGLITIIGSLASVIDMRLYTKEYPGGSLKFMKEFERVSLIFFVPIFLLQLLMLSH